LSAGGAAPARPVTEVAVGVLIRADGAVLMADRPAGKPYAGYWEFPGGKIEPGETVAQALERELAEELGVRVHASLPWTVIEHDYPHAYVRLHFRRVYRWEGEPQAVEGQRLQFHRPGAVAPAPLLPAAVPALRWIQLPSVMARRAADGAPASVALDWLQDAIGRGVRLVLWDEPHLAPAEQVALAQRARALAAPYGVPLLDAAAAAAPSALGAADGQFLTRAGLRHAVPAAVGGWLGAAAGSREELCRAAALGCDLALWDGGGSATMVALDARLAALATLQAPLPVYVPAPLSLTALAAAQRAGAHGLLIEL